MDELWLRSLLQRVKGGELPIEQALAAIKDLPYQDLGFAKVDHHRKLRCGFPEVIYCAGKTVNQVVKIIASLAERGGNILATKATEEMYRAVVKIVPRCCYHHDAGMITLTQQNKDPVGHILVVCAGTADVPVAEEAAVTAEIMGNRVERLYDVGVAGLHRLLMNRHKLAQARVLVVVAGMEGALPSVVAGLVAKPVIAVPTGVGYGANFNGLAALLAMLNSCAAGIMVVNIDNGFGGGYAASLINHLGER